MTPVAEDLPIAATVKLRESLWRRVKIQAIREGVTVSKYVEDTLDARLARPTSVPKTKQQERKQRGGE